MSLPVATPETATAKPRPLFKDFTVLQFTALVLSLDQLTKYLVIQLLSPGFSFPFQGFFRFTHVHNSGSAFGILQGLNTPLIFVSLIVIIILVLIYRSQPHPSNLLRFSLALQLGGAFGNLVDRMRLGYVTDFIDIGPWPVFNLADASIITGLVILAWVLTRSGSPKEQTAPAGEGYHPAGGFLEDLLEEEREYQTQVSPPFNLSDPDEPGPLIDILGGGQSEAAPASSNLVEDAGERPIEPERL